MWDFAIGMYMLYSARRRITNAEYAYIACIFNLLPPS
jgi:hypothetical protein